MACPSMPRTVTSSRALPVGVALREALSALVELPFASTLTVWSRDCPDGDDIICDWADANADRVYLERTAYGLLCCKRSNHELVVSFYVGPKVTP